METAVDDSLPFLGMRIIKSGCVLQTEVYRKPTDKGLLLHFQSHVDSRYNKSLLNTMLYRGFKLSNFFSKEIDRLRVIFRKLQYPMSLFDTKVKRFVQEQQPQRQQQQPISVDDEKIVRFSVPFKDEKSYDDVKKHLNQLNKKIGRRIQPVFTSRKLATQFSAKEKKHTIVSRQNVVYSFKCDLCEAGYVGYTCRHLYQRVEEHKCCWRTFQEKCCWRTFQELP